MIKTCFICKKCIYTFLKRTQFMGVFESLLRSQWYLFRSIEPLIFNGWVMWMYWFCSWWYVTGGTQRLREDMIHAFDIFNMGIKQLFFHFWVLVKSNFRVQRVLGPKIYWPMSKQTLKSTLDGSIELLSSGKKTLQSTMDGSIMITISG